MFVKKKKKQYSPDSLAYYNFSNATRWTRYNISHSRQECSSCCITWRMFIRRDSMRYYSQIWFTLYFVEYISVSSINWSLLWQGSMLLTFVFLASSKTPFVWISYISQTALCCSNKLLSNFDYLWEIKLFSCIYPVFTIDQLGISSLSYVFRDSRTICV